MLFKKLFLISIAILGFMCVSQAQTKSINGITYEKIDTIWYQLYNGAQYEVNESAVSVKFVTGLSESQKDSIAQVNNCNIVLSNSLGFYKMEIIGNYSAVEIVEGLLLDSLIAFAEPFTKGVYTSPSNDTYYGIQWHLQDEKDPGGTYYPGGIDAYKAWDKETGNEIVTIAIIDAGTDILHEDLEGNIWINMDEYNGVAGEDDDLNGYIDDFSGWDFDNNNNELEGDWDQNHGTHVAGIVVAESNDQQGVAGIAG